MKRKDSFYEMLDADGMVNDYQFVAQMVDSVVQLKNSFKDDKKRIRLRLCE